MYKALVKDLHPDMNGGRRDDEARLSEVVWAWEQIKAQPQLPRLTAQWSPSMRSGPSGTVASPDGGGEPGRRRRRRPAGAIGQARAAASDPGSPSDRVRRAEARCGAAAAVKRTIGGRPRLASGRQLRHIPAGARAARTGRLMADGGMDMARNRRST